MAQTPSRPVCITFGRFNPPTSGHKLLIDAVMKTARSLNADLIVYPSTSEDAKKNPLTFREKVKFLQQYFPNVQINTNSAMRTPFDAFKDIAARGYTDLYIVLGSDRVDEFQRFARYFRSPSAKDFNPTMHIPLGYHVVTLPRITAISATIQRAHATDNQFGKFLLGTPDPRRQDVGMELFRAVRKRMGIRESFTGAPVMKPFRTALREMIASTNLRVPFVSRLMGEDAAPMAPPKPATEVDRLRDRQSKEKIELQQRQNSAMLAAKLRDLELKTREKQQQAAAPKPAAR